MKIHDVQQGSGEWKELRRKFFTASNLGPWLLSGGRTQRDRDAWENAIFTKIGQISEEEEPQPETWAMKRGKRLEPLARDSYAELMGVAVTEVGFISHDSEDFGCSPDGLIAHGKDWHHGLEVKCHLPRHHARYLEKGGLREEHELQVQASMAASGIREWHLWGWHPELPPILEVFRWDGRTDEVEAALLRLGDDYAKTKASLKAKYAAFSKDQGKRFLEAALQPAALTQAP